MADRVYRVGRLEVWRARLSGWRERLSGWRERLRRPSVWGLLLAGLVLLIGIGWWYARDTAFARRAVPTTAVIQQVFPPTRIEHETGPPDLVVRGILRYQVNGRTIQTQVRLATCATGACVAATHNRQVHPVQIAYDPKNVTRVRLGRQVPTTLNPITLELIGLGVIFIAAGLYILFFDLSTPDAKSTGGRSAA